MTDDLLIWCRDDSPHGEHWRQNAFNDRDYCSGRPAPEPEPADLLDEATRLVEGDEPYTEENIDRVLLALVERVQQAEAERQEWADLWKRASMGVLTLQDEAKALTRERDEWHQAALTATAGESRAERERDEARGKLDKVRTLAESAQRAKVGGGFLSGSLNTADVLAILDGKE